ncbi:MAG: 50S ribosomal protein L5 [archaeon]
MNKMAEPKIDKICLNMGVGESGEPLTKAMKVLTDLTGKNPVKTFAKATVPGFGVRQNQEIGCKVTLRNEAAENFLRKAFKTVGNKLSPKCFDKNGNFSFGVSEHIELEGMRYDPKIGIFGFDVAVNLIRPGYRIAKRKKSKSKIGNKHKLTPADSMEYVKNKFGVTIGGK